MQMQNRLLKRGVPRYLLPLRVHLRLAIEGKHVFVYYLFPNIYTYISKYYFQKSFHAYC